MEQTIVNLSLPYTFSDEGEYLVSSRGKLARISIEYVQSTETLDKITGVVSMGKVAMKPDDPEGLANFSKVTVHLPFITPHAFTEISNNTIESIDDTDKALFQEIRKVCALYLNKIREAIRYCTKRYWIRDISEGHLYIYSIQPQSDDGRTRTYSSFIPSMDYNSINLEVKEEALVKNQITEMLKQDTKIDLSERLYLDSLNFFSYRRFQEVIINANTAMEVALDEQVRKISINQGKTIKESKKIIDDIFKPRKFRNQFKRAFFRNIQESELSTIPIFKDLNDVREKRGNVVHPGIKFFSEDETRDLLFRIYRIITWIKSQKALS